MLVENKTAQVNHPQNFKEVFHLYYPKVFRQAAYLLGNMEAADDIAQEAFLKLYYSPPVEFTSVGGWLARVAANLCYNYLKSEKSRKAREENNILLEEKKIISLEDAVFKKQEARQVRKVLNKMNERDRTALLLKFSDYSYAEISQVINVEKSSVGTILARAIKKFKSLYLQAEGENPDVL